MEMKKYASNSKNLRFLGIRLIINRKFLKRLFKDYYVSVCKQFYETRLFFKSSFD